MKPKEKHDFRTSCYPANPKNVEKRIASTSRLLVTGNRLRLSPLLPARTESYPAHSWRNARQMGISAVRHSCFQILSIRNIYWTTAKACI